MSSSLSSISTWILPLKVLLFAAGVASLAMVVGVAVPVMLDFAVYDLPEIWSAIQSCLKPLYLYFLINVIILTIFVTSRFHLIDNQEIQSQPLVNPTVSNLLEEPQLPIVDAEIMPKNDLEVAEFEDDDEFVISRSTWIPQRQIINFPPPSENSLSEFVSPVIEKPLVTSRFALQKPIKTSPDGNRALRVAKPKKHETLGSTWKTITDGRHMPLTRHLRKSDTFENHRHSDFSGREEAAPEKKNKVMKKATTLKDRTNYDNHNHRPPPHMSTTSSSPASDGKRRKEGSPSHDELNRRVEAFIKKFNDEMRLQRHETMKQHREMTNRGSHRDKSNP